MKRDERPVLCLWELWSGPDSYVRCLPCGYEADLVDGMADPIAMLVHQTECPSPLRALETELRAD